MHKIIIDNIVFSIQKIGGISVVWYEIIKRLIADHRYLCKFVEFNDAVDNHYRKLLPIVEDNLSVFSHIWYHLLRYVNPKLNINEPYIFHSSYYRISNDKSAINFTTVHDFTYERDNRFSLAKVVHKWQKKQAVMKSNYIICISENTKKDLLFYYKKIDPKKVFVVYNGVSDDYVPLINFEYLNFPFPSKTYCIYVGARKAYKNFNLVVEALSKTNFNLVIVGPTLSDKEKIYLDKTIGKNRYYCESNIPNKRLNELYNGAFALLYLSTYEGFGIPCLESQKSGCPVVALNASSIPEVICDKSLLIDDPSVENVIGVINKLQNQNYYQTISEKGLLFARQFSWDRCYNELIYLYDIALNKSKNQN